MKDEEDDNIVPEGQEDDNTSAEEGFDDVILEATFTIIKKTETILLPKLRNVQGLVS
jgi:hypothetical protein